MLRLMLFRHAKSDRPSGVEDHERPLAHRGREESALMGRHMAREGLVPAADEIAIEAVAHTFRARVTATCQAPTLVRERNQAAT